MKLLTHSTSNTRQLIAASDGRFAMNASRTLAVGCLAAAALLASCGRSEPKSPSPASASTQQSNTGPGEPFCGLVRLPEELSFAIGSRHENVDRIEVEPMLRRGSIQTADIRQALLKSQDLIQSSIAASQHLTSELPDPVEFSTEEVQKGIHLNEPRGVLLNHVRLLRADAIRCWEDRAYEDCAKRFVAGFEMAAFLLSYDDRDSRFRGGQSYVPLLFDLNVICEAGFAEAASPSAKRSLGKALRNIDPYRCLVWDDSAKAAVVRESLLERFPN